MDFNLKTGVLAVAICGCVFTSCREQEKHRDNAVYKTMQVKPGNAVVYNSYPASIRGVQHVEIRPQVSGLITKICIDEGTAVRKGEPLFIIDQVAFQAAVETAVANVKSAESKVATARLTLESKEALYKEQVVSDFDLQTARNGLQEAEALLAQARAEEVNARNNLSYTVIKSPVDGVSGMIPYKVGALVNPSISEPLVTVSGEKQMHAYFSITENQLLELAEEAGSAEAIIDNMPAVRLELSNGTIYEQEGRIDAVSGTVDPQTGSVGVRAVFENPKRFLRNGGSGRIIIPYRETDCLLIPKTATYEIQNKVFVYKVVENKAVSQEVVPFKLSNGTEYIIQSGLTAGDVIVAEGAGLLHEGTVITTSTTTHQDK